MGQRVRCTECGELLVVVSVDPLELDWVDAVKENIPMNQLIALALAEKISALMTEEYLEKRAARGNRERFEEALSKVPDVEPPPYDRL